VVFLCVHGVFDSAGSTAHSRVTRAVVLPSGSFYAVGTPDYCFRSSMASPHIPLSNASSAPLQAPSHGSGPRWFATPFLYDSFIHNTTPVYPDAIRTIPAHAVHYMSTIM
jgi:hypothetical protein